MIQYRCTHYLFSTLFAFVFSTSSEASAEPHTVGVEPFAALSVIEPIINGQINKALTHSNNPNLKFTGSHSLSQFKSQADNNEFSFFYGHPGYTNYLHKKHDYLPIIALHMDAPALIITNKNNPATFKKKTKAYTLEDHDIFTHLGRQQISGKPRVQFVKAKNIESIIEGIFSTPSSIGIISKSDLSLLITGVQNKIKVIEQTPPVKYSYISLNPKRVTNIKAATQALFNAHKRLAKDKSSYFYGVKPILTDQSHSDDLAQYKAFQPIFNQY
jgi:hypothetical protein